MEAKDYVEILAKHDFTQVQIAKLVGVEQSAISRIQRGSTKDVMSKTYRKLQELAARVIAGERVEA